jgi:predicted Zn-dependent peptidase
LYGYDLEDFNEYAERIERLNPEIIQECVNKYFNEKNYIEVVLKPEQKN